MSILDFLTQDELDDLDEDHRIGFMQLVNIAQRKLSEKVGKFDPDHESDWRKIEEIRYSFMNVVLAAAKRFEIEPFVSMEVPKQQRFGNHDHLQFKADLDHYVTQLILDNSLKSKRESVEILPNTKDQLRTYIVGLRQCVEKGNMSDAKRQALLKRLDAFEGELEKRRLNMMTVASFAYFVLGVPGTVWASADITQKLTTSIMQTVAEAKAAEDKSRKLPAATVPKALSAPRANPANLFGNGFDEEVPF